jgi:DNA-directed RNA polymerase specialized sigma24 family protein
LADEDKTRQLTECIDALEIDEQFFLELYINRALAPVVLAKVFGISRPAVDMRKRRIIAKLRECFKLKGFALDM